jgi:hypothetical protein
MFQEKDFIKRQLQQLAAFLKRLLSKARDEGEVDTALDELAKTGGELLGVPLHFLDVADPKSAALLLRSREKIDAYAEILLTQAELSELKGDAASAQALRLRAQAVRGFTAP